MSVLELLPTLHLLIFSLCASLALYGNFLLPIAYVHNQQKQGAFSVSAVLPFLWLYDNVCCRRIILEIPQTLTKKHRFINFFNARYTHAVLVLQEHSFDIHATIHGQEQRFSFDKASTTVAWLGKLGASWKVNDHYVFKLQQGEQQLTLLDLEYEQAFDICQMLDSQFNPPPQIPHHAYFIYGLLGLNATFLICSFCAFLAVASHYWVINTTNQTWTYRLIAIFLGLLVFAYLRYRQLAIFPASALAIVLMLNLSCVQLTTVPLMDQYWPGSSVKVYTYKHAGAGEYVPLDAEAPQIPFKTLSPSWTGFPQGSVHHFELMHGRLGTWQLSSLEKNETASTSTQSNLICWVSVTT